MADICKKTGAVIFVAPENAFFRCDAFELHGIQWFRITNKSINRGVSEQAPYAAIHDYEAWYDREAVYSTLICDTFSVESYPESEAPHVLHPHS